MTISITSLQKVEIQKLDWEALKGSSESFMALLDFCLDLYYNDLNKKSLKKEEKKMWTFSKKEEKCVRTLREYYIKMLSLRTGKWKYVLDFRNLKHEIRPFMQRILECTDILTDIDTDWVKSEFGKSPLFGGQE